MVKKTFLIRIAIDLSLLLLAMFLALTLHWSLDFKFSGQLVIFVLIATAVLSVNFYFFGVFHQLWRFAGISDFLNIFWAATTGISILLVICGFFFPPVFLPALPLLWIMLLLFFGGIRVLSRLILDFKEKSGPDKKNNKVLIIGAGGAGAMIVRTLQSSSAGPGLQPVGFIDDDSSKKGLKLYGLPVLGTRTDILNIIRQYAVNEVIIAIPSATPDEIKAIIAICRSSGVKIKILPSVLDILQGKILLAQVQELQMEDLLQRNEVEVQLEAVKNYLQGQKVLVTGAGGSIGSELCRQICALHPKELLILGRGENSIHEIKLELAQSWPEIACIPIIADIRDRQKLMAVFDQYKPTVVFHAAAHKHVSLMEQHPDEAFKNNVFGTYNTAMMADRFRAKVFVLISTDKAVNPTSVMGLTKSMAEMIIRYYSEISTTKFVAVRFGNVLGSRGSVVQIFRKQIAAGGPVTVTHPEMRRYFMTIREAVQLVMDAGALAKGGELFMLDMGKQIKVLDLAREMIHLSGLSPGRDIEIKFTGIRPGEKLSEELKTKNEKALPTQHHKIFCLETGVVDYQLIELIRSANDFPTPEQLSALMNLAMTKYNFSNVSNNLLKEEDCR